MTKLAALTLFIKAPFAHKKRVWEIAQVEFKISIIVMGTGVATIGLLLIIGITTVVETVLSNGYFWGALITIIVGAIFAASTINEDKDNEEST